MPAELFVDTSGWYPLILRGSAEHRKVADALRQRVRAGARVVTSNLVVAETHALLLRRVGADTALAFVRGVADPPNLVVRSTAALEAAAVADWLDRFDDQPFSLTDAVSFAIMAERRIAEALALDHHFRVAGFATVPAAR
ncbi:MAG: type II toxin-antitoxin system VapC family toxin [Gemmatimonadales bacterium]